MNNVNEMPTYTYMTKQSQNINVNILKINEQYKDMVNITNSFFA